MAIAYGTIATDTSDTNGDGSAGSNTQTITKPTSTASGDLLVAFLGSFGSSTEWSLAGWTSAGGLSVGTNALRSDVLVKVAGGSEPADYTFIQTSTGTNAQGGAIVRFTGTSFAGAGNVVSGTGSEASTVTSHTWDTGVTPPSTSAIYMMCMFGADAQTTWSAQAVTNNNPSWTERFDTLINATTTDGGIAIATADVTNVADSGGFSATSSGSVRSLGILLVIDENTNASVTLDLATLTASPKEPVMSGDANITLDLATMTASPKEPTVTGGTAKWLNPDKSDTSPTIVNPDKS